MYLLPKGMKSIPKKKKNASCGIWTHAWLNTVELESTSLDQLGQTCLYLISKDSYKRVNSNLESPQNHFEMSANVINIDTQHGDMIVVLFIWILTTSMMCSSIIMERYLQLVLQIIQFVSTVLKMEKLSILLKLESILLFQ